VDFGTIEEPAALGARMSRIPGLVEHGIFENLEELYLAEQVGWGFSEESNEMLCRLPRLS
jgi:ribose 5-phosphate isomerase